MPFKAFMIFLEVTKEEEYSKVYQAKTETESQWEMLMRRETKLVKGDNKTVPRCAER